ncbi:MAG TPA: D-alanyl-D-alanine carboxypeptidase/D-alanyl-D-alanine-endopeptidase [Ignavibacteriales bacterium]|nr:D-alanyl-D-alanine carboxypeptidase/D-alanyl-D-alanine-endopeptidase [Ignavibacteriales bacterium]
MKKNTKFSFSILLFVLLSSVSYPQSGLKAKLDTLLSDSIFQATAASVNVYDLTAGKPLYQNKIKLLLKPASNMKIITTSAALCFLGPEYQFQTNLYYTGTITPDSIMTGDLYVEGKGDPDFGLADLDSLVKQIKLLGIKEIKGHVYGDVSYMDSIFWGKGWMWDDDPSTDAPYMSALNINSNTVTVNIKPGFPGTPAVVTTVPETPFFKIINRSLTISGDSSTFKWDRDWLHRTNNIVLSGNLPLKSSPITEDINVYDPARYFLTLLKERLEFSRVLVLGTVDTASVPTNAKLFYTFNRPYGEVIVNLNKTSDNLSAEMTLRAMAYRFFGKPATPENGIKMVDSLITLSGLNYKDYRIVDGSGVSHYNLVTTELLLDVLKYIYYSKPRLFGVLYNSFPNAGVDGSLGNRMKNTLAFNNLHAKTGSLSGVNSLSGYVTAQNKHMLAFSAIIQNYVGSASRAIKILDEIGRILSESGNAEASE